jgi:MFS family permease
MSPIKPKGCPPQLDEENDNNNSAQQRQQLPVILDEDDMAIEANYFMPQPPDGGWGWVVVFGSFMIHVICDGVAYSFGVFLDTFVDHFEASHSEVSWMGSIMLGVTWGSGPIASILTNKYGCRAVCIAGSIVAFVGLVISIFAPNIYFMYFSFGLVSGLGLGLMYLPAIVSVNYYFEKRRSLAIGLAVCGSGVGTFIFAPVTQLLLSEYGWQGTVLIEAAILLNGLICGAIFRPLYPNPVKYQLPVPPPADVEITVVTLPTSEPNGSSLAIVPPLPFGGRGWGAGSRRGSIAGPTRDAPGGSRRPSVQLAMTMQSSCRTLDALNSRRTSIASSTATRLCDRRPSCTSTATAVRMFSPLVRQDIFYGGSLRNFPEYKIDPNAYRRSSIATSIAKDIESIISEHDIKNNTRNCLVCCSVETRVACVQMADCRLLLDPIFVLFAVSNLLSSVGLCVPYVFLPDRGRAVGLDPSSAAFLISIVGISNMVGRLVFGFISDFECVNRLMLYNSVLVLCGAFSVLSTFCVNYPLLGAYSASFGLLIGIYICLTSIVLVDLLGLEKLSNAFGLVLLFQGIGAVMGPPIAGAVFDLTHNYDNSFHLMGACLLVSGLMLYPIPCIRRYQKMRRLSSN